MELFETPRQLQCQHTFCEKCLKEFIAKHRKTKSKSNTLFPCPLCRAEIALAKNPFDISIFPVNRTMSSLLDSKQLMKALANKNISLHDSSKASSGILSKLKTTMFTRSKSTQTSITEELRSVRSDRYTDPPRRRSQKAQSSSNLDSSQCSEYFTFQKFGNMYQYVLQQLTEPLVSVGCSSVRKSVTLTVNILSILMYLIIGLNAFLNYKVEWGWMFISISISSVMLQVCCVRLRLGISMFRNRIYAFLQYSMIYVATFYVMTIFCLILWEHVGNFVVHHRYAFTLVNRTVWTPEGFKLMEIREFNRSVLAHSIPLEAERKLLFDEYIVYLNYICEMFWLQVAHYLRIAIPIMAFSITFKELILLFCRRSPVLASIPSRLERKMRHRR